MECGTWIAWQGTNRYGRGLYQVRISQAKKYIIIPGRSPADLAMPPNLNWQRAIKLAAAKELTRSSAPSI
jgi:hypothetical protein